MFAFIIRRLIQATGVMLVVGLIAFMLFQYVGDPVSIMLGQDITDEDRIRLTNQLGLDQPAVVQFYHFLVNASQGDFGISLRQGQKVSTMLLERLPATLELSFTAAVIALVIGIPLGVFTALNRKGFSANFVLAFSLVGVSLPTFLIS
jgi:peptide/nickel transport system permease protein